jgi:hypothetical protein
MRALLARCIRPLAIVGMLVANYAIAPGPRAVTCWDCSWCSSDGGASVYACCTLGSSYQTCEQYTVIDCLVTPYC